MKGSPFSKPCIAGRRVFEGLAGQNRRVVNRRILQLDAVICLATKHLLINTVCSTSSLVIFARNSLQQCVADVLKSMYTCSASVDLEIPKFEHSQV